MQPTRWVLSKVLIAVVFRPRFRILGLLSIASILCHGTAAATSDVDAPLWPQEIRRVAPGEQPYERVPAMPSGDTAESDYTLRLEPDATVRVSDSTGFVHEGVRYRLAATEPLPGNRICVSDNGTRWACGLRGRSLLRLLIVGKRLRCRPGEPGDEEVVVTCLSGSTDIAARIVAQGLALTVEGDATYAEPLAEAMRGRKGLWSTPAVPTRPD